MSACRPALANSFEDQCLAVKVLGSRGKLYFYVMWSISPYFYQFGICLRGTFFCSILRCVCCSPNGAGLGRLHLPHAAHTGDACSVHGCVALQLQWSLTSWSLKFRNRTSWFLGEVSCKYCLGCISKYSITCIKIRDTWCQRFDCRSIHDCMLTRLSPCPPTFTWILQIRMIFHSLVRPLNFTSVASILASNSTMNPKRFKLRIPWHNFRSNFSS